jgi:hypothetical protein
MPEIAVTETSDTLPLHLISGSTLSVMAGSGIGEPALLRLLSDPQTPPLTEVMIRDQQLGPQAVRAIMSSGATAGLHSLHLSGNPIGDAGLSALAQSPRLAQLESLQLQGVGATPAGIKTLAESPHLKAKNLALGWQAVGNDGAKALVAATQVKHLRLESAQVGGEGAEALLSLGSFESVSLIKNPVHLTGLGALSPTLQALSLVECPLSTKDVQALASAQATGLKRLSLKWSPIEDAGLTALQSASWLSQLESLDLSASKASAESRRAFIEAYGEGRFLSIYTRDL